MNYPEGLTEEEVMGEINRAAWRASRKFVFGYYSREDIYQEARVMALEALPFYDSTRPLYPFLLVHIRNRLCNLKRNKLRRPISDAPCQLCAYRTPCGRTGKTNEMGEEILEEGRYCGVFLEWKERNDAKAALMEPCSILESDRGESETLVEDEVCQRDMEERINHVLPSHLRSSYLRLRAGERISKEEREDIEEAIRGIIYG